MDLAAWWRARRWRALLELIEQLPTASRFRGAVLNDPEQARMIALAREYGTDDDDTPEPWSPPVAEYDLTAQLLREILHTVTAAAGAKSPAYFPAPRTEVDRQQEGLSLAQAVSIGTRYGFTAEDFGLT